MEPRIIIETALENLQEQTGLVATWHVYKGPGAGEIEFTYDNELYQVPVEIKSRYKGMKWVDCSSRSSNFPPSW